MKRLHRPISRHARPHASAFSLMEVLVAIGLFALGFAAVAAIFPAGALLQRETADDIQSRHVERNAHALILGTPLDDAHLSSHYSTVVTAPDPTELAIMHDDDLDGPDAIWSLDARSYPSNEVEPLDRRFFWVPLMRDADPGVTPIKWEFVVFVLRRQENRDYDSAGQYPESHYDNNLPMVESLPARRDPNNPKAFERTDTNIDFENLGFQQNDQIVDSLGAIYRVERVSPTRLEVDGYIEEDANGLPDAIWHAPRPEYTGRAPASPTRRILTVRIRPEEN